MKLAGHTKNAASPGLLVMAGGLCWFAGLLLAPGGSVAVAGEDQTARQLVGQLIAASRIYDQRQMAVASNQLARIGKPAVAALLEALEDVDGNVRWQAIVALGRIGAPDATVATRSLVKALDDIDPDVRTSAAAALGTLKGREPYVVQSLRPLTTDPHGQVRCAAWWALWKLADDQQAMGQLIQLLADKDWMVNQAAGKYLAMIGAPAVIHLTSALKESPQQGQAAAAESLAQIGVAAQPAVVALQPLLAHDQAAVATAASRALGRIGPAALPALLQELTRNHPQSRLLAIEAIATMGPQGAAAVTALIKRLNHPDQQTRRLSIKALGAIGPAAQAAVPELIKLLAADDADLRGATCQALGKLGSSASSAQQRLEQLASQDPVDFVQRAARQAARQLASPE
ncbi:MAG: HEAT repeat domain-containing protein [Pirellulaceae bacterium]